MKVRLILEYDGSFFSGWQSQANAHTVQSELGRSLEVYLHSLAKREGIALETLPKLTASGRTDAGVHALGQVVSFEWPAELPFDRSRCCAALNGISSRGLGVLAAEECSDTFDARFSAHTKRYFYRILLRSHGGQGLYHGRVWHLDRRLDVAAMAAAAKHFRGTHDFSAFRAADCTAKTTVRTLEQSQLARVDRNELRYFVQGTGFLKQMVRIIVGTLVEVGLGRLSAAEIPGVIASLERSSAGETAPACGLYLEWVRYTEPAA
ncbi:MAG: tRNA pseudouridine(38-40) synthase TruA [Bdellovibrionales bacterium]|nr:tRNA pseudouridine(38-40) synthase TruA [Bdellovibrionales bacterium]